MENTYLLEVLYVLDDYENHFENVYSNLEKAKQERYKMA